MNHLFLAGLVVGIAGGAVVAGLGVPAFLGAPSAAVVAAEDVAAPFVGVAPVSFDDAVGDATDTGSGDLATQAGCAVGYTLQDRCMELPSTPGVGTSGRHYDLTKLSVVEEREHEVVFALEVAKISDGFAELEVPSGLHRMSWYGICWMGDDNDYCSRNMYLSAMVHDGHPMLEAHFDMYVQDCNEWWWCSWSIPVEVAYGEPATLTFTVPKEYASVDGRPLTVDRLQGYVGYMEDADAFPMWHPGFTVHTPLRHVHDHSGAPSVFQNPDATYEHEVGIAFAPPAADGRVATDAPLLLGTTGTHVPGTMYDKPELDLLGADVYEDGTDLVVLLAVRELAEVPHYGFDIEVALGLRADEVWELGWRGEGGKSMGYMGECVMAECQHGVMIEIPVEVTPGSPGFVALRLPMEVVKPPTGPDPGSATTVLAVSSMYTEGSQYWGSYDEPTWGDIHHAFMVDGLYGGTSYVFGSGHRASLEAFASEDAPHGH